MTAVLYQPGYCRDYKQLFKFSSVRLKIFYPKPKDELITLSLESFNEILCSCVTVYSGETG